MFYVKSYKKDPFAGVFFRLCLFYLPIIVLHHSFVRQTHRLLLLRIRVEVLRR